MTATYDPAEVERLVREAREDDRKMAALEGHERAPWRAVEATRKDIGRLRHYVTCIPADHACWSGSDMVAWSRLGIWTSEGVTEQAFAEAIARTRNNLGAMADQLEAACAGLNAIAAQVDQTDPQCPIGTALTRAGLTRSAGPEPTYDHLRRDLEAARTEVDRIPDLQAAIGYEIERRDAAYADLAAARARVAELEGRLARLRSAHDLASGLLTGAGRRVAELEGAVERMAPVVAVAERIRDHRADYEDIVPAVDAYRAKIHGTG